VASKAQALIEALRRVGGLDLDGVEVLPPWSGAAYGYRSRARLAVVEGGSGPILGYRRRASREVIAVERCPVLVEPLEAALAPIGAAIDRAAGTEEIEIGWAEGRIMLAASAALLEANPRLGAWVVAEPIVAGGAWGPLQISPAVFSQANDPGNEALLAEIAAAIAAAPPFAKDVLELYAGTGNFTRLLARRARSVVAIEASIEAVARAPAAIAEWRGQPVDQALVDLIAGGRRFDAALVDPPRTGLEADTISAFTSLGIEALAYVSCDAATFARDAGRLAAAGLSLRRVRCFDFYPQTPHLEVLGWFAPDPGAIQRLPKPGALQ
jgi:23S rRNA (uracil1939-C5)-methyltransferase